MSLPDGTPTQSLDKSSLVEDLIDVLFSPAAVFTRRAGKSAWGAYAVVTVILIGLLFAALGQMQGIFDTEIARAVAQMRQDNPNLSAETLEGITRNIQRTSEIAPLIAMPFTLLVIGLGVWLVGKLLGGELSFGGGVMIASFAYLPKAIELALVSVQGLLMDTSKFTGRFDFSWGVGRFLKHDGPQGLYNLLGRVDLFTLWTTILIAIGLAYAAKVPKSKAYTGAALVWLLGAVPALIQLATGK